MRCSCAEAFRSRGKGAMPSVSQSVSERRPQPRSAGQQRSGSEVRSFDCVGCVGCVGWLSLMRHACAQHPPVPAIRHVLIGPESLLTRVEFSHVSAPVCAKEAILASSLLLPSMAPQTFSCVSVLYDPGDPGKRTNKPTALSSAALFSKKGGQKLNREQSQGWPPP